MKECPCCKVENQNNDVNYYPIADIRNFRRQLHLLKDHIKEGGNA